MRRKSCRNVAYSNNSIEKYSRMLKLGTLAELFIDNTYRSKSELEDHTKEILSELGKNPARTLRKAATVIEKITGLRRTL